jgi:hypothetical protein
MKKENINFFITIIIMISFTYFLSGANIFEHFVPRRTCMLMNENLINLHMVSDSIIFISYVGMGALLVMLSNALKTKVSFSDYLWKFGGFIFFCGLTHAIAVVNIYITFYWIDGILKLITCWFSVLVFFALLRDFNKFKKIRSPAEWNDLGKKLNEVIDILNKK